jgi:hypothetical protein
MKYLEADGIGRVSRIGLGTWQFGSRESPWGQIRLSQPATPTASGRRCAVMVQLATKTPSPSPTLPLPKTPSTTMTPI